MTEYFKRFTMDKDEVTVIDFVEGGVFECKYSDEAKSLCNVLNDLDYEKSNLKKENQELKQQLKELQEFKDNYDKNMELMQNSEYVQDFLFGNL